MGNERRRLDRGTTSTRVTRRVFLVRFAVGSWFVATFLAFLGAIRSAVPSVLPDPVRRFKIGRPRDYIPGLSKEFSDEGVIVVCDEEGLYAISIVCTHLGCVVRQTTEGFQCPCHGSRFAHDGEVMKGPAPRDLEWYAIEQTHGGQLAVDRARRVSRGSKMSLDVENA